MLRLEVCDAEGRLLTGQEQPVQVPANGQVQAESRIAVDAATGERLLRWRLLAGPKEDRKQVAGWERSAMVATDEYAFILFDKEPIARGMEFRRDHVGPQEITTHGLKRWIWKAGYQSHPQGWWHSIYATITDAFFPYAKADPDFEFLHDDPRYQDMVAAAEARLSAATPAAPSAPEVA